MGWLFMRDMVGHATLRAYLDNQFTYERKHHRLTVLASSMVGTTYYTACERIETNSAKQPTICIIMCPAAVVVSIASVNERKPAPASSIRSMMCSISFKHGLDTEDVVAIGIARPPATRLGFALQLCFLRYLGRHLRAGELLPAIILDHIADQVGLDAGVIANFARRTQTRYDQLAAIKALFEDTPPISEPPSAATAEITAASISSNLFRAIKL